MGKVPDSSSMKTKRLRGFGRSSCGSSGMRHLVGPHEHLLLNRSDAAVLEVGCFSDLHQVNLADLDLMHLIREFDCSSPMQSKGQSKAIVQQRGQKRNPNKRDFR